MISIDEVTSAAANALRLLPIGTFEGNSFNSLAKIIA